LDGVYLLDVSDVIGKARVIHRGIQKLVLIPLALLPPCPDPVLELTIECN
jgi:hypothetical protein